MDEFFLNRLQSFLPLTVSDVGICSLLASKPVLFIQALNVGDFRPKTSYLFAQNFKMIHRCQDSSWREIANSARNVLVRDRPSGDGLSGDGWQSLLGCLALLKGRRGLSDHIDDYIGFGEHWHVTAFHLNHSRSHALGNPSLKIGMNGVILQA